jgi:hypothetical protein
MSQAGFTPIRPYYSTTSTNVPTTGNMLTGEIAINTADRVIYTKDGTGAVVSIGNGATGGGGDTIFVQNGQTVNNSYSIPSGINAMSTGPIAIASGAVVTIPSGSVWAII